MDEVKLRENIGTHPEDLHYLMAGMRRRISKGTEE